MHAYLRRAVVYFPPCGLPQGETTLGPWANSLLPPPCGVNDEGVLLDLLHVSAAASPFLKIQRMTLSVNEYSVNCSQT